MRKSLMGLAAASLMIATGCAKNTSELPSSYVSPLVYQDFKCSQLSSEMARITRRVNELGHSINKNAQGDSVAMGLGLVLFWPALFFIDGDSPEAAEYSRLKGEYEAVEKMMIQKECSNIPDSNPFSEFEKQVHESNDNSGSSLNRRRR